MLKRLKRWLRRWLAEDESDELLLLDCLVRSREGMTKATFVVTGSRGICLEGYQLETGRNESWRLIGEGCAVSRDRFWELWRRFNPEAELRWEGGDEAKTPD